MGTKKNSKLLTVIPDMLGSHHDHCGTYAISRSALNASAASDRFALVRIVIAALKGQTVSMTKMFKWKICVEL